jgi:flagellar biosynthetic protein FliQ
MTPEQVIQLSQQALQVLLLLCAPVLAVALGIGLLVSIFQAATQINEMTLTFIPKLVAMLLTLLLAGPWMLTLMTDYMRDLFNSIPGMVK